MRCRVDVKSSEKTEMKTVNVTVTYVGENPFVDTVPSETVLQSIKVKAMKDFGLAVGDADKYVLRYGGADMADTKHVGDFGVENLVLTLTLNKEVNKG